MKKLILIAGLLLVASNGWAQTNEKIHQICMDAVDYEGCTKVHKDIRKGNCSIVRETYRKFSSELDTTKIAIENVKKILFAHCNHARVCSLVALRKLLSEISGSTLMISKKGLPYFQRTNTVSICCVFLASNPYIF